MAHHDDLLGQVLLIRGQGQLRKRVGLSLQHAYQAPARAEPGLQRRGRREHERVEGDRDDGAGEDQALALGRHQLQAGVAYATEFAAALWPLLVLAVAGAALAVARPPAADARRHVALLGALTIGYSAFFVYAGGDWMPAFRFFVPVVPLLAVLAGIGVAVAGSSTARAGAAIAVLAVCAGMVATSVTHPQMVDRVRLWEQQVRGLANIGAWVERTLQPGTTIAAFANGALSHHAERLVVVDLLGLTDEHIAREGDRDPRGFVGHAASDWEYVVDERRPAVIHDYGSGWLTGPSCSVRPELAGAYEPLLFQPAPGRWSAVLVRADLRGEIAPLLAGDGEYVPVPCP